MLYVRRLCHAGNPSSPAGWEIRAATAGNRTWGAAKRTPVIGQPAVRCCVTRAAALRISPPTPGVLLSLVKSTSPPILEVLLSAGSVLYARSIGLSVYPVCSVLYECSDCMSAPQYTPKSNLYCFIQQEAGKRIRSSQKLCCWISVIATSLKTGT